MLIDELVHTCSHEDVARAAVLSLGVPFAGKVISAAQSQGMSIGAFAVVATRRFDATAGDAERRSLRAAMTDKDQPLLAGLRHILEPALDGEARSASGAAAHGLTRPAVAHMSAV